MTDRDVAMAAYITGRPLQSQKVREAMSTGSITRVDRYVRHLPPSSSPWKPFARFPTWMWRNDRDDLMRSRLERPNKDCQRPNPSVCAERAGEDAAETPL